MTREEEIKRGDRAKFLLENELFIEAFDTVEKALVEQWKLAPIRDIDGQHELKLMLKLLNDVKSCITQVANSGKLARIGSDKSAKEAILRQSFA